ncbi:uncharacterized protein LOC129590982 [Paramacrobiotus metropolitanus]|uniref:uncharacterized protein LOC129590982 n=1 Tax=Paramacrobiotus metropolitanus TaxID=2943436 RepID=UPI00244647ED|nr:uncharacterized protein LOC129590982 [Paramacrobiotus metropolitanus]XP_055342428.1 uncharacterized protein LOC129590982 [Paramacrobiotus metropolitanus]XP_055342429.1 uncharacterized protein LOC129590982 [Paramacrobiotus metropolitanus]XP_055342430.1 uncharacterized protein LOC129590982 [Paramacrobiotus metropolitanus]
MMSTCRRRTGLLWSACVWCLMMQLQVCTGCLPSRQRSPSLSLKKRLAEAMLINRQDDRVILPGMVPSNIVTDSVVYRPRLGEDAAFNCSVPAGVDWRHVSWLHQDRTVFRDGQPVPVENTTRQKYNFTHVNLTLIFVVPNVTMRSGGSVQCIIEPSGHVYMPHRRVLQRYQLLPLITHRSDVFAALDAPYVTATEGETVTVQCSIRLPLPEGIAMNLDNHMMWVHRGRIVSGPWEEPYGLPMPTGENFESGFTEFTNNPGQLVHAQLHFRNVTQADGGYVQCLLRPHQGIHEWIVKTTTLLIFPRNSPQSFH